VITDSQLPASFRDPSGFVFWHNGVLYRQVNMAYKDDYDRLIRSGLYQRLVDAGLLIPHSEASLELAQSDDAYKVIQPQVVEFISYPYEWSFSQLKAAALATLAVQKTALEFNMSLKDSSAYNIQFSNGKPVLIDTLSFEHYHEDTVWVPYRQFCQHFLAPLALMKYTDVRLNQLLRVFIDGIPLDLAARLLPFRSYFGLPLLLHIHLHARSQQHFKDKTVSGTTARRRMSRNALLGLLDSLEAGVKKLHWNPEKTAWAGYYQDDSYSAEAINRKQQLVAEFIKIASPKTVWDLGANIGLFSRIASKQGIPTVAWDVDPGTVDINFRQIVKNGATHLLPLVLDLTNPSPAIGWNTQERMSFVERGPVDMILALALIHHLVISNNAPLEMVASFLAELSSWLVIEFVPKSDPRVQKLLSTREDIFPNYTRQGFENEFGKLFVIKRSEQIRNSKRILYLMVKR
jgi:ribosomal protein L11 methylase PrmA